MKIPPLQKLSAAQLYGKDKILILGGLIKGEKEGDELKPVDIALVFDPIAECCRSVKSLCAGESFGNTS